MKKIILVALVCWAGSFSARGQNTRSFVWGGTAGFESQLLNIQSIDTNEPDQLRVQADRAARGASWGVFGRWRLWKGIFVQQEMALSVLKAKVDFFPTGPAYYHFTDLELPLHLVLTNPSDENTFLRGSFLLGGRIGWNFARQNTDKLYLLRERLAIDAGLGVEIRLKKGRLQPEFVYSLGLNNMHDVRNTPFDWVTGRIVRDKLTLRLLIWWGGD